MPEAIVCDHCNGAWLKHSIDDWQRHDAATFACLGRRGEKQDELVYLCGMCVQGLYMTTSIHASDIIETWNKSDWRVAHA